MFSVNRDVLLDCLLIMRGNSALVTVADLVPRSYLSLG